MLKTELTALGGAKRISCAIAVMFMAFLAALTPPAANALYDGSQSARLNPYALPRDHRGNIASALSAGKFLVASRTLKDPRFAETVVLLLEYGQNGAAGVIINRPTELKLSDALPDVAEFHGLAHAVYIGGPVMPHGTIALIRSSASVNGATRVFGDVHACTSIDTLKGLAGKNPGADTFRFFAGYAGWGPRQLDGEVARGGWHVLPGDADTVFDASPANVWMRLISGAEN